jgi:hypothetical protein
LFVMGQEERSMKTVRRATPTARSRLDLPLGVDVAYLSLSL